MHHSDRASRSFYLAFRRWTIANATPSHSQSTYTVRRTQSIRPGVKTVSRKQTVSKSLGYQSRRCVHTTAVDAGENQDEGGGTKRWIHIRVPWSTDRALLARIVEGVKLPTGGTCYNYDHDTVLVSSSFRWLNDAFGTYRKAFRLLTGASNNALAFRMRRLSGAESGTMMLSKDFKDSNAQDAKILAPETGSEQGPPLFVFVAGETRLYRQLRRIGLLGTIDGQLPGGVKVHFPIPCDQRFICVWATDISALTHALNVKIAAQMEGRDGSQNIKFVEHYVSPQERPWTQDQYITMAAEFKQSRAGLTQPMSAITTATRKAATTNSTRRKSSIAFNKGSGQISSAPSDSADMAKHNSPSDNVSDVKLPLLTTEEIVDVDQPNLRLLAIASEEVDQSRLRMLVPYKGSREDWRKGKQANRSKVKAAKKKDALNSANVSNIRLPLLTIGDMVDVGRPNLRSLAIEEVDQSRLRILGPAEAKPGKQKQVKRAKKHSSVEQVYSVDDLRTTLSRMTNSVVLITARDTEGSGSDRFRGVTVSSFATVTMEPKPFISFNIRVPSRTYTAFQRSGEVCVHVLSANSAGMAMADTFTKRYEDATTPFKLLSNAGANLIEVDQSAPRVDYRDGVIAWLRCSGFNQKSSHTVGDHQICVFAVKQVIVANGSVSSNLPVNDHVGLAYAAKSYRRAGSRSTLGRPLDLSRNQDSQEVALTKDARTTPDGSSRSQVLASGKTKSMQELPRRRGKKGDDQHHVEADHKTTADVKPKLPVSEAADQFLSYLEQEVGNDTVETTMRTPDAVDVKVLTRGPAHARAYARHLVYRKAADERRERVAIKRESRLADRKLQEQILLEAQDKAQKEEARLAEIRKRRELFDEIAGSAVKSGQISVPSSNAAEIASKTSGQVPATKAFHELPMDTDVVANRVFDHASYNTFSPDTAADVAASSLDKASRTQAIQDQQGLLDEVDTTANAYDAHGSSASDAAKIVAIPVSKGLPSRQIGQERREMLDEVADVLIDHTKDDTPPSETTKRTTGLMFGKAPATLAPLPHASSDQYSTGTYSPTQQTSRLHTASRAWQPNSVRHYSSAAPPFRKVFVEGNSSSDPRKLLNRDMDSDKITQSEHDSLTCPVIVKDASESALDSNEHSPEEATDPASPPPDLSTTVNDLLCHSFVRHGKRNARLYNMRTVTHKAEARLKQEMADGTLTPELSEKLESLIASNERFIAWTLAERAAFDLAEMLDQGRIVHSRISFIEGCIERGQKAIYEEAQAIMIALEKKAVTIGWYEKRQQLLVKTEAVLRDELVRLRAFHEDDDRDDW